MDHDRRLPPRSGGSARRFSADAWRLIAALAFAALAVVRAAPAAADPAPVPAILGLFVNTVDEGTAMAAFLGNEILIAVDDLTKAGVTVIGGKRQAIGGRSYVALSSLAPGVRFAYDEQTVVLRLTVDPHLLTTSEIGLGPSGAPPGTIYGGAPSAFLNYAVNGTNATMPSLFGEQGLSLAGSFLDNTVTVLSSGRPERGATSLTLDNRTDLTRTTLGDITASGGTLGGAVSLAGVGYSKNFAINPYFVPFPTERFAGIIDTPSTADIYVNGQLVRTVSLPPGPFNLLNIPGATGAGVTRVVIRNAFGQQQELGGSFYQSTSVLAQGVSQFSYNAGVTRNLASLSALGDYQLPAVAATHLYGFTNIFTGGGFVQADPHVIAGGPQAAVVLPVGQLSAAAARSDSLGAGGWSASLGYSYQNTLINFGTTGTYTSARYADLGLTPEDDRPRWQVSTFIGVTLGQWSATIQLTPTLYRTAGVSDQASAMLTRRVTDRLSASLTLGQSRIRGETTNDSIALGITYTFGNSATAAVSASQSHDGPQTTAQVTKSLPQGPGYGYLAQVQTGQNADDAAHAQYQTTFGTYEADFDHLSGQSTVRYSASGALVAIGGDIKPTIALRDAYALVRVPGAQNVTGYLSNLDMGRTDASGDLLIPNLLSYYGNRLEINPQDVPLDYIIDNTEIVVAPPYRGGSVVAFPVHRFQAFIGTLAMTTAGGAVIPAYGELSVTVGGKSLSSPVGEHGEFYFESLPAGTYPARLVSKAGTCDITLAVPRSAERIVKLGAVTCAAP